MDRNPPPRRLLVPIDQRLIGDASGKPAVFGTVLSGDPQESFLNLYDGGGGRFACGVWQCTPGTIAMADWPHEEFCVLLAGRVVITPQGGRPQEYRQGDAFVIPRGFTGIWDVRETIRKYYAIEKPFGPGAAARRLLRAPLSLACRLLRRGEPALARKGFRGWFPRGPSEQNTRFSISGLTESLRHPLFQSTGTRTERREAPHRNRSCIMEREQKDGRHAMSDHRQWVELDPSNGTENATPPHPDTQAAQAAATPTRNSTQNAAQPAVSPAPGDPDGSPDR